MTSRFGPKAIAGTIVALCVAVAPLLAQDGQSVGRTPEESDVKVAVSLPAAERETPAARPRQAQAGGKKLKWLLIGAAAAGAVLVTILVNRKDEPIITVGDLVVGDPQ
jgi:hypothetical protein